MKNIALILLISLLISGCEATKFVTGAGGPSDGFRLLPMFQNPVVTDSPDDMSAEQENVCIGFVSKIYF